MVDTYMLISGANDRMLQDGSERKDNKLRDYESGFLSLWIAASACLGHLAVLRNYASE